MPNIKSAIKRVKVTEKKNLRNRMIKSAMKTQIKKFETAVSANEADVKLLSATQGAVDKAAAKGVIHKNAANRKRKVTQMQTKKGTRSAFPFSVPLKSPDICPHFNKSRLKKPHISTIMDKGKQDNRSNADHWSDSIDV